MHFAFLSQVTDARQLMILGNELKTENVLRWELKYLKGIIIVKTLLSFHRVNRAHSLNNKRHTLQSDKGEEGYGDFTDNLVERSL